MVTPVGLLEVMLQWSICLPLHMWVFLGVRQGPLEG
ncbi:MAG: hypothetical protein RL458_1236 [Pseudomonadota bacterium]